MSPALPIDASLPELRAALSAHSRVILQAPPGAGKTTRVPLALGQERWLQGRKILILEPRRLAARAACARMAEELGENIGARVGYRIRFEQKIGAQTQIEVVTEGILTRRLQQDPELDGVGLVIFDEYHERSLHADLALTLCLDAQQGLREDLKILLMSATLDIAALADLLDDAPIIRSAGRAYPVAVRHRPVDAQQPIAAAMAAKLPAIVAETEGDVLVFLPGGGEIRRCAEQLQAQGLPAHISVHPLYGDLPRAAQDAAIQPAPPGQRKIVLATPIAETSLTIEGVRVVVDSGWRRAPRFDPRAGMTRLELQRISMASAEQRRGRAGRVAPGICYRLWEAALETRLEAHSRAEILQADLAPLLLELAQWGVADAYALRWLDPPPAGALAQARDLLRALEALDARGHLTSLGRQMAVWPLHPRLAHMLCRAIPLGWQTLACDLAALLSERDILRRRPGQALETDISLRLHALRVYREQGKAAVRALDADPHACARVIQAAQQLRRRCPEEPANETGDPGVLLAFAYPDRIAQRRAEGARYRLSGGRGALLPEGDALAGEQYLVIADVDAGQREARAYLAAALQENALSEHFQAQIETREAVAWDDARNAVSARREQRLGALVLSQKELRDIEPEAQSRALLEGIARRGLDCLPWDKSSRALQARLGCLRDWLPEQDWPDVSDAALSANLEEWLGPYLNGFNKLAQVATLNLGEILRSRLNWPQQQALERLAPTHLEVPSGSRIALVYEIGTPPVLAVRLQEMFGLAETPRIADGRVACVLHLLSPAQRPVQVTQDLAGFWAHTYADVKKELKGRYPKHYWPDDPWQATATRRVRPR